MKGADIGRAIEGGAQAAMAAAARADVVILAIGDAQTMSGEARSRTSITLPTAQAELVRVVRQAGKPVVVVLSTGRALALPNEVADADAILVAWFLGSEGGRALADVLTGKAVPSGRLPVSFPHATGQEPLFYKHMSTGRPPQPGEPAFFKAGYTDVANGARYPFGHGLTYSTIAYAPPQLSAGTMPWNGSVEVSALVRNAGRRDAEEVVQLYLHDVAASVTRPVRELKGFQKVRLAAGEERRIVFTLRRDALMFVGRDLAFRAEPGRFRAWIAPSSAAGEPVEFELLGQR